MRKLKFYPGIVTFLILLYLEIVFKMLCKIKIFDISLLYIFLFSVIVSLVVDLITKLFNKTINKILYYVILLSFIIAYGVNFCIYNIFGFYFNWEMLATTDQVAEFAGDGVKLVFQNIGGVLLLLLPLIVLLILVKKFSIKKDNWKLSLVKLLTISLVYGLFVLSLNIKKDEINSSHKLYYTINNTDLNITRFGVLNGFLIDTKRSIFGFEEKIDLNPGGNIFEEPVEPGEIVYNYNNLDIDFDKLIASEKNSTIKSMHEYFKNETGTKQNEYTKFFEGKNLILFMAESFNEIAVSQTLTPTLYKLANSGFVFKDFYTPTILSTIGGEFQELSGLYADSAFLGPWKSGKNAYPMGIATVFKELGYSTYAYHDHYYTFQSRNKYLKALGFDNFVGCKNGLEKSINCKQWPESDVEMINATFDDYINSEKPFMVFYASVSGHGGYSWGNAMSKKHKAQVENLNYSLPIKAYLASQIELNDALETLINKLEASGKLDDTVIALVGDHYPYLLAETTQEVTSLMNEVSTYKKDSVVEINHSNFILWNNKMETVTVEKVGSQIDVLPTIYNLFGVKYDSRLIIGKDILSTAPGLAIFGNRSWVSDKGTYFAGGKFVAKDGEEVDKEYIKAMNSIVASRVTMSKNIMKNDYYRKVLGD